MGSAEKTENKAREACVEAGTQRYSVGMDTPRFLATSLGGTPLASSFLADSILLSVIFGFSPPFRPAPLGAFQPGAGALDGQLALHFGQARHDVEEKPPGRRAGIDGIGQAPELDAMLVQAADQITQLLA